MKKLYIFLERRAHISNIKQNAIKKEHIYNSPERRRGRRNSPEEREELQVNTGDSGAGTAWGTVLGRRAELGLRPAGGSHGYQS